MCIPVLPVQQMQGHIPIKSHAQDKSIRFRYSKGAHFVLGESTMQITGAAIQEHSPRLQQSLRFVFCRMAAPQK